MITIDSNNVLIEILEEINAKAFSEIKNLYHHSTKKCIKSICKNKCFWFTPFEKQLSEKKYSPNSTGVFYNCCFSQKEFSKEEIENNGFKGNPNIHTCLDINFESINELFDFNKCCIMVDENNVKHNIKFANKNSIKNKGCENDLINEVFIRMYKLKTTYINTNDKDYKPSIEIELGNNSIKKMDIATDVGKKIEEKYSYQDEFRFVAELACTHEITIENVKRLEIFLNPKTKLNIKNIQ